MDAGLFNERIAIQYDDTCSDMFKESVLAPTIDLLAELSNGGRALEFAIGTGRVALPLKERGVDVHGIEISEPMVNQLLEKPGGDQIPIEIGDMATSKVEGEFQLVYLVYNTITNLLTQDEQVNCFSNAAAHLKIGGRFLIEVEIPMLQRIQPGESHSLFGYTPDHIGIDEYDIAKQTMISHHLWLRGSKVEKFDSVHRYAWPSEYDLMARIAGLSLVERWGNWQKQPYTSDSTSHISVWEKTV